MNIYYRLQTKLSEGNVFTGVCMSDCSNMFIWGPPQEQHLVVVTETEACKVSKRAVCILMECFLVYQ